MGEDTNRVFEIGKKQLGVWLFASVIVFLFNGVFVFIAFWGAGFNTPYYDPSSFWFLLGLIPFGFLEFLIAREAHRVIRTVTMRDDGLVLTYLFKRNEFLLYREITNILEKVQATLVKGVHAEEISLFLHTSKCKRRLSFSFTPNTESERKVRQAYSLIVQRLKEKKVPGSQSLHP